MKVKSSGLLISRPKYELTVYWIKADNSVMKMNGLSKELLNSFDTVFSAFT
jgi:hypothetical protein